MNKDTPKALDAVSEREAFEAHFKYIDHSTKTGAWGESMYCSPHVQSLWDGWQAHANLSTSTQQAAKSAAVSDQGEPAPPNSLPDFDECARLIENSDFRARAAAGLEGSVLMTIDQSPEPTELHRFIYEYDDADAYRSAWFMHRLEKVIEEVRAPAKSAAPAAVGLTDRHALIAAHNAIEGLIAWDARRDYPVPYKVRDPLHESLGLIREALSAPMPAGAAVEWPDDGELESWRSAADDLLRGLPSLNGPTVRSAAFKLQNAYAFAREARAATTPTTGGAS